MTGLNDNQSVFISLLSAGLWETVPRLNASDIIDYTDVLNMAERQSVVGIVAAVSHHFSVRPFKIKYLPLSPNSNFS